MKTPVTVERRLTKKIALITLLATLPIGAAAAIVASGDTVNWATIERNLNRLVSGDVLAQVNYDCPAGWTNQNNCNLNITDCDCSDSDSDSDGAPGNSAPLN